MCRYYRGNICSRISRISWRNISRILLVVNYNGNDNNFAYAKSWTPFIINANIFQDDFLLRHYDKGPCKNKLGHSRASVIWHRTQVVGIFAGFGVLLLVASPFLLLAAPCILCCKCKVCRCCDEDLEDPLPT